RGLLGRQTMDPAEGVLLVNPPRLGLSLFHSIHMFGGIQINPDQEMVLNKFIHEAQIAEINRLSALR
ncbi:MAG: hypothetical protein R6V15_01865, partial [Desulfotignum sp.]